MTRSSQVGTPSGEAAPAEAVTAVGVTFCSWCGGEQGAGDHDACRHRLASVDPPRYCAACARRMVVQVDPVGWTARCSRHGEITSDDGRADR